MQNGFERRTLTVRCRSYPQRMRIQSRRIKLIKLSNFEHVSILTFRMNRVHSTRSVIILQTLLQAVSCYIIDVLESCNTFCKRYRLEES